MVALLAALALAAHDAGVRPPPAREVIHVITIRGSGNHCTRPHGPGLADAIDTLNHELAEIYPSIGHGDTDDDGEFRTVKWRVSRPVDTPDLEVVVDFERRDGRWYSSPWRVHEIPLL